MISKQETSNGFWIFFAMPLYAIQSVVQYQIKTLTFVILFWKKPYKSKSRQTLHHFMQKKGLWNSIWWLFFRNVLLLRKSSWRKKIYNYSTKKVFAKFHLSDISTSFLAAKTQRRIPTLSTFQINFFFSFFTSLHFTLKRPVWKKINGLVIGRILLLYC